MEQEALTSLEDLDKYLSKIEKIFSIDDLLTKNFTKEEISNYYKLSSSGYKYFHSKDGAVHMALNYDGIYNEDGFYTQAKEISALINENQYTSILELGCGKGFNSIFLSKHNPDLKFQGVDITHKHLSIAKAKARDIHNLTLSYGDFHELEFKASTFDLVFELEAVCHATDNRKVLESVYKVLKPKGKFVLYEGFRQNGYEKLPNNLKNASVLTEKSMSVNESIEIGNWLKIASEVGFKLKSCDDISDAIMPNLTRFQRLARGYFKYPLLSKLFLLFLPRALVMNSIAGLLMPFTIKNQAQGYFKIVLEK